MENILVYTKALCTFYFLVAFSYLQLGNPDIKYRKMGIVGTLKIISTLGDVNATVNFSSSQVGSIH